MDYKLDHKRLFYEYKISESLYKKFNKQVLDELDKIIIFYIDIFIKLSYNLSYDDTKILDILKRNLFFSNINNYGYIETPELLETIRTFDDLIKLTKDLNIREKLSLIKNFQNTNEMNCIMYNILLEYNKDKTEFNIKFNQKENINVSHIEKITKLIEKLLDMNIKETGLCYDNKYNQGECNETNKKLYTLVNEDKDEFKSNVPKICSLWVPFVHLFNYQNLIKIEKYNRLSKLIISFEMKQINKDDDSEYRCMNEVLEKYPLLEEITDREKNFIMYKTKETYNYKKLPFNLMVCSYNKFESFYLKLRERKNKLSISYSSGHTLIFLLLADYINNINIGYIIISMIIWTTPYNHAINEILGAAKMHGCFEEYDYDKDILVNVNEFLKKFNLETIEIEI